MLRAEIIKYQSFLVYRFRAFVIGRGKTLTKYNRLSVIRNTAMSEVKAIKTSSVDKENWNHWKSFNNAFKKRGGTLGLIKPFQTTHFNLYNRNVIGPENLISLFVFLQYTKEVTSKRFLRWPDLNLPASSLRAWNAEKIYTLDKNF